MSFNSTGFLSTDMREWEEHQRRTFSGWFDLADHLNQTSMKVLFSLRPLQSELEKVVACLLFCRLIELYQSTIVLARMGADSSAKALVRSTAESVIALAAVANGDNLIDKLIPDHIQHKTKLAKKLLDGQGRALSASQIEQLQSILKEHQDSPKGSINWEAVAQAADCLEIYTSIYRHTSADAVHTSIDSLTKHLLIRDDELAELKFRPEAEGVPEILFFVTTLKLHALGSLGKLFGLEGFDTEVDAVAQKYQSLCATRTDLHSV